MMKTSDVDINRKSYRQICPMATALDYIGDRWTILILRELLGGSARFLELKDGLPGIASNLLTERLKRLEADGLVRQIKRHNTIIYALTDTGQATRPLLEALGFWGAQMERLAPVKYERSIRAIAMALQSILVRAGDTLPTDRLVIELEVDGEIIEIVLGDRPTALVRLPSDPHAQVQTTMVDLSAILNGQKADASLLRHISGKQEATDYLIASFNQRGTWEKSPRYEKT